MKPFFFRGSPFVLPLALLALWAWVAPSYAGPDPLPYSEFVLMLHNLAIPMIATQEPVNHYVLPNEVNPERVIPILSHAPVGAYLTVGTERAFIAASLDPNITHLFVLDRDPAVIRYNEINVALLKASHSEGASITEMRERYLYLRLQATESEWAEAMGESPNRETVSRYFTWWEQGIRKNRAPILGLFQAPSNATSGSIFHDANYLFDDELFARVQSLAVQGRIQNIVFDLGESKSFHLLAELFARADLPISVFDVSNAWYPQYLGPVKFSKDLQTLEQSGVFGNDSIVLLTDHHGRIQPYANAVPTKEPVLSSLASRETMGYHEQYNWSYHGYRSDYLKRLSKTGTLEIEGKTKLKTSSFDDLSTEAEIGRSGNWCTRWFRKLGVLPTLPSTALPAQ